MTSGATDDTAGVLEDLTGEEVCAGLQAPVVGEALGVTGVTSRALEGPTPQCSYSYASAGGTATNVVIAVQRTDGDLGGRRGEDAFEFVVDLNRSAGGPDTLVEPIDDAGRVAAYVSGSTLAGAIVLSEDGRVVTIFGAELTEDGAAALATAAAAAF